ncbi:MAG: hybrid sensor histidine kinase/response regulator [Oligoflexales bacterium]|nr:hybrid sensor histidine kinase/response regulator [Oligoflexales bacterium]
MKPSECSDLFRFDFIRVDKNDTLQTIEAKIDLCKPHHVFYERSKNEVLSVKASDLLQRLNKHKSLDKAFENLNTCISIGVDTELEQLFEQEASQGKVAIFRNDSELRGYLEIDHGNQNLLESFQRLKLDKQNLEEKIDQKDEFIGILSHDIRNPLGIISVCCDYMLSLAENTDTRGGKNKYIEFVKRIKNNVKRSNMLVQSLLEVGKSKGASQIQVEDVYLPKFLSLTVQNNQFLANSKEIQLVCGELEEITAPIDQKKIQQVIENLTGNAIKFTPRKKKIHYSVCLETIDGIDYACISVRDEGRGIPQDKINNLFEKYSQGDQAIAKELGVGLGLFIVKQFTDLHQGKISINSREGEGTSFVIKLPHAFKGRHTRPIDSNNLKILVADDDEDIRYLVQMVISDLGYEFIEAENGEVAFEKYQLHKPDLIVSDIRMPKLDGLELLQKVKQIDPKIPYILMSGYYDQAETLNIQKVFHPDLMVTKPFVKEEFQELLNQKFFSK